MFVIKKLLVGLALLVSTTLLPATASATVSAQTTYWSGSVTLSNSFTTQSFYAPSGTLYYRDTVKCNPSGWYRVELWKSGGTSREYFTELTCTPDNFNHNGWTLISKSSGNHYLKFIHISGGTTYISKYELYQ